MAAQVRVAYSLCFTESNKACQSTPTLCGWYSNLGLVERTTSYGQLYHNLQAY